MLLSDLEISDTFKKAFERFQQDPLNIFKVNVRRTRADQLRGMLADPEAIDLKTFLYEVWGIENKTYLRGRNIDLMIFERKRDIFSVERLLDAGIIKLPELENALASGDLELHGNYIWMQGGHIYAPHLKNEDQKIENIRKVLRILNNPALTPLTKAEQIEEIPGFGENNATGLVMIFHPNEFALINTVSREALKKLGSTVSSSKSLELVQSEVRDLKEALGAKDFLELDWFLYLYNQGKILVEQTEPALESTWFDYIKRVLAKANEPLHESEIVTRVLALGLQTKGKTPDRTVSRVLTTNPDVFERVDKGRYRLKETPQMQPQVKEYTEPSFDDILRTILVQGIRIDERTIHRYHLSLKTRGFVILSGLSGIGKTWLTEAYANAIGARYLLVPVAPNWTTNEDLLGFTDPLVDDLFHHTAFSRFLEDAAREYEQAQSESRIPRPHHLVLDEMNLARVEYYFAKFVSAMEVRMRNGVAAIDLGVRKVVPLYNNLCFIGTINVDETTHGFADKIYDRAQLIELTTSRESLQEYLGDAAYSNFLMNVWEAVYDVAPFAFRILAEIDEYVQMVNELGFPWHYALDEQILQKILPKCKGADLRIGSVLEKLATMLPKETFPLSAAKVQRMLEGYRLHGFTSYF